MEIKNQKSKIKIKEIIILIILASMLFFFKLGSFSLYDAAETTYGEFVKQILLTGDWITMHFNGQIIFDKPPLYFWLATLATYLFGFNEFALRFWAALAGVLTVIVTYFLGKTLYHKKVGFLSALILMSAFQFIVQARIAEIDVLLALFLNLALLFLFLGYQTSNRWYYLLSYPFMGLATLTKGIIGVVLPLFVFFLFLTVKKEFRKIKESHLLPGILIILLIALPWYLVEYLRHGGAFLNFVFGFLFLSRFQTVVSGHPGPWYYYFISLILGFAPWSAYLPYSLWKTWKQRTNESELFTLCYLLPVFIVFSLAKTKLPNYLLPLFPFLAITVGKAWQEVLEQGKADLGFFLSHLFNLVVVSLIFLAAVIAGQNYTGPFQALLPQLCLLAGILSLGTLAAFAFFLLKNYRVSFLSTIIMVFVVIGFLTFQTLPAVENFKGTKELAQKVSHVIKDDETIASYQIGNRPGVVFYNQKPILFLDQEKDLLSFLKKKKGYCFTTTEQYEKLKKKVKLLGIKGDLVVIY